MSDETRDHWWRGLPYSGEMEGWGHERCPWNPFPPTSPWGRDIDRAYRRDKAVRRNRVNRYRWYFSTHSE